MKFLKLIKLPFQIIGYRLFRTYGWPILKPLNITLSVTNNCNSKCKTCNIWKQKPIKELTIKEWRKILKSIGNYPLWFTITGGEPFLRKDIDKIIKYICKYNNPQFINIASNGLSPEIIFEKTKIIANICKKSNVILTINISIDELDKKYDDIRGTKNGFNLVLKSINYIKKIQKTYKKLNLGVNIVASAFNDNRFIKIYNKINKEIKPDSIVSEIATNRRAFFLNNEKITPNKKNYLKILDFMLKQNFNKNIRSQIITNIRHKYYQLVKDNLINNKKISCYASIASCEILSDGRIINCCMLSNTLGNLKNQNYNLNKIWHSKIAKKIRNNIKKKNCYCTLSNPFYTNYLMSRKIK